MSDGPKPTPDEARLLDILANTGSPEAAADNLLARLLALEEAVAELEAASTTADPAVAGSALHPQDAADNGAG